MVAAKRSAVSAMQSALCSQRSERSAVEGPSENDNNATPESACNLQGVLCTPLQRQLNSSFDVRQYPTNLAHALNKAGSPQPPNLLRLSTKVASD